MKSVFNRNFQDLWHSARRRVGHASNPAALPILRNRLPRPRTEFGRLLWSRNPPLIHNDARMIVIFSPKSACSSVVIWFLHQIGEAQAAQQYHYWPHRYRIEVYYRSPQYRSAFDQDLENFSVVRVVRDPFERAVSSFRHVLGMRPLREKVSKLSGIDIANDGMSFAQFLDFLDDCDLTTCDAHYGLQHHPIENRVPVSHLINVSTENLFARLNEVEADLGLPRTDFASLSWIHQTEHYRHKFPNATDIGDPFTARLKPRAATRGPWPPNSTFLTAEAREHIADLYRVDLQSYINPPASADAETAAQSIP